MTDREMELRLQIYMDDLKELTATGAGRRFFAQLFDEGGCLLPNCKNNADVYRLAGRQEFAWKIWRDLHAANPEASLEIFDTLMQPISQEQENNDE